MIPVPIWLVAVATGIVVLAVIAVGVALLAWLDLARERAEARQRVILARLDTAAPLRARAPSSRFHLRPEDDDHDA